MLCFFILFAVVVSPPLNAQSLPVYVSPQAEHWADSMLNTLSYKQKIGQLFMVDAFSNKDIVHVQQITQLIDSFYIGGLIFFQGGPIRQALLTNYYQHISKVPLMIGIDGEWGLSMRIDSTMRFPRQMTLGAGRDTAGVYAMGEEIARQCKRMGIQINFAPDIDINNNPANPIINSRSFGENKEQVTLMGKMYMQGMQRNNVLACGKHFPGHGNTDSDSHLSLPVIHSDIIALDSLELTPFKELIKDSLASVMVAHLYVPSIDSTPNRASTLSEKMIKGLLQQKLGFTGLIFTDALNMKGVASFFEPGELEWNALLAGNDVLLYSQDVPKAIERIHYGIQNCEIDQSEIDGHVRKILMAKYWSGAYNAPAIDTTNLIKDLFSGPAAWLNYQLYNESVTLLKNQDKFIPFSPYYRDCMASVVLNDTANNPFQLMLNRYGKVDCFNVPKDASVKLMDSLAQILREYDRVIVSVHNTSINAAKNFNVSESMTYIADKLSDNKNTVFCVFGNAYVLGKFNKATHHHAVVIAYEDTYLPQYLTAQKIFGASSFTGKIPVTATIDFLMGQGLTSSTNEVIKYSLPEEMHVASNQFDVVDTLINKAIRDSVFPGCQILVALKGNVIYNKSFGYFTYDKTRAVKNTDVYDLASVTKVAATSLATMLLFDKHKLDPDAKISKYLPEFKSTNKKDLTLRQIMAHEAGLQAWIPFYKSTVDSSGVSPEWYRRSEEKSFAVQVADSLFMRDDYKDSIWSIILKSEVNPPGKYVYSDLGLLIMQRILEKISGKSLDEYVTDNFYKPLGLWETGFLPKDRLDSSTIVPTELDTVFRHQLLQGHVHDPAAAMLGGVAGNAGVFSNAQSLAILMQMLLNHGEYGGRQFIHKETIDLFTAQAYPGTDNRRGLIFDRQDDEASKNGPTAKSASLASFGHSGFTGTYVWADPKNGLVYVFLSNRVHPSATNNKLSKQNIRTDVMQVVYDAAGSYKE